MSGSPSVGRVARAGTLVTNGTIIGTMEALLGISFGALVFAGALTPHVGSGIGMGLFTGAVMLVVTAVWSSIPGTIGSIQDSTAAVLAVIAAGIAAELGTDDPRLIGTVVVAVFATTALTGASLWLLGILRLGQLVRFVPFPVIGGFLAGTGWLLLSGGVLFLAGGEADLADPSLWLDPAFLAHILPGLGLAVVLLVGTRRLASPTFVPATCAAAVVVFYTVVLLGPGLDAAEDGGWLVGPFPGGALWPPDTVHLTQVDLGAVASQAPGILTVAIVSAVALLLNATGIELGARRDADLDRELRVSGVANLVAATGGGLPGFPALSLTNLAHRSGFMSRWVGLVAAVPVIVTLVFSADVVGRAPRLVLGGMLAFVGLGFLVEWLVDGWSRLLRMDYAVVALIVVVIATVGFLEGVAIGILATVVLFLVTYSRADVVKHALTGDAYPSHVDRPPAHCAILEDHGAAITIFELQGFLFFGTANRLLERIRARLEDQAEPPMFLVIDFRRVTGVDSSTVLSFQKAAQVAGETEVTVALTGLRPRVAAQVEHGGLFALEQVRIEDDLPRAVQWCEDQVIARHADDVRVDLPPLRAQLASDLGSHELAERLYRYLVREAIVAGDVVIAQGDESRDLFFLEAGTLTVVRSGTERGGAQTLRTMMRGTVVGEAALYLDAPRLATVVADSDGVVYRLPASALDRMEREDPDVASGLHRLLGRHLATRLANTLRAVDALGG